MRFFGTPFPRPYPKGKTLPQPFVKGEIPADIDVWTDIIVNVTNCPFITLTESLINNIWYHEKLETTFYLTSKGFVGRHKGYKRSDLERLNLLRKIEKV